MIDFHLPLLDHLQLQYKKIDTSNLSSILQETTHLTYFDFDGNTQDYQRRDFKRIGLSTEINITDTKFEDKDD
ncbi:MAG: hypothetical protein WBG90_07310 [Saonia sp.]